MPTLSKPKWEKYARGLAKGLNQAVAYEQAGFVGDGGNASKLANNPVILERVKEIIEYREKVLSGPTVHDPDAENDAGEPLIEVTENWVIERLAANVIAAQSMGNHGAANKALEMLGHHLGMSFNDKKAPTGEGGSNVPALGTGNTFNILQMTDALHQHAKSLEMKDITPKDGD